MQWRRNGLPILSITTKLQQECNVKIPEKTLTKLLCQWGVRVNRPPAKDTPELRARIVELFRYETLTDEETARVLESEGFVIGQRKLARMRKEMGLFKRLNQGFIYPKQLQQTTSEPQQPTVEPEIRAPDEVPTT